MFLIDILWFQWLFGCKTYCEKLVSVHRQGREDGCDLFSFWKPLLPVHTLCLTGLCVFSIGKCYAINKLPNFSLNSCMLPSRFLLFLFSPTIEFLLPFILWPLHLKIEIWLHSKCQVLRNLCLFCLQHFFIREHQTWKGSERCHKSFNWKVTRMFSEN